MDLEPRGGPHETKGFGGPAFGPARACTETGRREVVLERARPSVVLQVPLCAGGKPSSDAAQIPSRWDPLPVVREDSRDAKSAGWSGSYSREASPMATTQNCGRRRGFAGPSTCSTSSNTAGQLLLLVPVDSPEARTTCLGAGRRGHPRAREAKRLAPGKKNERLEAHLILLMNRVLC
jgi:hypothetical protein